MIRFHELFGQRFFVSSMEQPELVSTDCPLHDAFDLVRFLPLKLELCIKLWGLFICQAFVCRDHCSRLSQSCPRCGSLPLNRKIGYQWLSGFVVHVALA